MSNIFIYWNYKDSDSKKIYSFLKEDIIERMKAHHNVYFHKEYRLFSNHNQVVKDLKKSDLALFFTHGDNDAILKFKYTEGHLKNNHTFISKNNSGLLKDKKIVAMCCLSGRELGSHCVVESKAKSFVGFKEEITYGYDGESGDFRSGAYKAYSEAFFEAFNRALEDSLSIDSFSKVLKICIQKKLTEHIVSQKIDNSGNEALNFHIKTANSVVAFGNITENVF